MLNLKPFPYLLAIFRKGFCQGMTYISSLCVFASGWYSCCILLDRYLYLCTSPATAKYLSTPLKAKFMCVSILAIGVVVYLNISLLYTVYVIDYITFLKPRCMSIVEYETVIEYFNKVELSLNLGVPYLCIVVLLLLITVQHCTSQCSQQCNGRKSPVETEVGEVRLRSNNGRTVSSHGKHSNNCKPRQNMDVESPNFAALSIATGVTFIILTFPAYVMRVIRTVYSEPEHVRKMTLLILLIDQLLQFVFYSRFAFNGLIYFISESSFRKSAAKMLSYLLRCRIFLRKSQDKSNVVNMEERESPTKTGLLKDGNPKIGSSEWVLRDLHFNSINI